MKMKVAQMPILALALIVTAKALRETVITNTGMSRSMFYELLKELKDTPGATFNQEKQTWSYHNPNAATLN